MVSRFHLPKIDDFHVHLRQGPLMESVSGLMNNKGIRSVYVMPNLTPPITTTDQAVDYRNKLQILCPNIEFFMTLYLTQELSVQEIIKAKQAGIIGIKSYPKGVTTNSQFGIEDYKIYYPIFSAMEKHEMVLNLHGEVTSNDEKNICVMNSEIAFLSQLKQLHLDFPKLKIVLEHATTKEAVEMVCSLGETVGCTITPHHLVLSVDDWAGNSFNFCKPVAKYPVDRQSLRNIILQGHPRFFLGSDSAPHPKHLKMSGNPCAGIYTGSHLVSLLAHIFDSFGALDKLQDFACKFGRDFYTTIGCKEIVQKVNLYKEKFTMDLEYHYIDENGIKRAFVPFMAGEVISFSLKDE